MPIFEYFIIETSGLLFGFDEKQNSKLLRKEHDKKKS